MPRVRCAASAFFGLLGLSTALFTGLSTAPVRADNDFYAPQRGDTVVVGTVQSVSRSGDRLVLTRPDGRRYVVDAYGADVIPGTSGWAGRGLDLERGMRVEVTGTLREGNLLEASWLRVLPEFRGALGYRPARPVYSDYTPPAEPPVDYAPTPQYAPPAPAPTLPLPAEPPLAPAQPQLNLDGLIRDVDTAHDRVSLLTDDDKRYDLDVHNADIILRGTARAGQTADLVHGMRVRLVGALLPSGLVEADRLRVLPPVEEPAPPPAAPPAPVVEDMSVYTGILIDARSLPRISRSPAPAIYGPLPDQDLLYPDRSHVPTPDEVQEESIVRYYHAEADADAGVGGTHPLILTALAVLGPAEDAVQLSAEDTARFQALDKRLHFTRTWKVGFLIPGNQ